MCETFKFEEHAQTFDNKQLMLDTLQIVEVNEQPQNLQVSSQQLKPDEQLKDKTRKTFLKKLGFMHMVVATNVDCDFQCLKNFKQMDLNQMLVEGSWPADWAFTVFGLFSPVHSFLHEQNQTELATRIRVILFNNYCRKLRAIKLVAFMSVFFANLHYDFLTTNDLLKGIQDIGICTLTEFDHVKKSSIPDSTKPELRIYHGFVTLFLENIFLINPVADCNQIMKNARKLIDFDNAIIDEGLHALWHFLLLARDLVSEGRYFDLDKEEHLFVLNSGCGVRWRKAIVTTRLFAKENDETELVKIWKRKFGLKTEKAMRNEFKLNN